MTSSSSADFSCIICYDQATEPVVTKCGHLFCWSCLDKWLSESQSSQCPICQGLVRRDVAGDIIPLYGKGKPSSSVPHPAASANARPRAASNTPRPAAENPGGARPQANREEPPPREERANNFQWNIRGGGGGFGFLFFAPQVMDMSVVLFIAAGIFLYYYFPWGALREWWSGRGGEGRQDDQQQQQPNGPPGNNARFDAWAIFVVVTLFSCAALVSTWLNGASALDDGDVWTL